jgi:glutathione S-transferase
MLKLYYTPGACSLSPHIALREAGLPFELERVDLRAKTTASGEDFTKINGKGYVPALALDNGELLTEGVAIVQYVADRVPDARLAPAAGQLERYRLQEWLNYITSELHKNLSTLFGGAPEAYKETIRDRIASRLEYVDQQLGDKEYLLGSSFSVADGYLFWAIRTFHKVTQRQLPARLAAFQQRVAERPAVKEALQAEGFSS